MFEINLNYCQILKKGPSCLKMIKKVGKINILMMRETLGMTYLIKKVKKKKRNCKAGFH